ncbi:MAG: BspA family leucine-rich repeat surface protein, partial [Bacilli bacterium]|nr:BspA family leucine-rich repeat surface protein [Bacilli bacterium]
MSYMFNYCKNLTSLDISNFNVVNVTDFTDFLTNTKIKLIKCLNPSTINTLIQYLPDKSSVSNGAIIIDNRNGLNVSELTSKNWSIISTSDEYVITEYKYDKSIYFDFIPVFNSDYDSYFVYNEYNDEDNNIVTRKIVSNTLPTLMRFGSSDDSGTGDYTRESSLLEVMKLITDNLNDMSLMFYNCNNLAQLDVSNFDTSEVTDMKYMFYNCNNLTQLDVSNFNTSQVTTMYCMFYGCNNLTQLDVSNFDTSNVAVINNMFQNCNNLTSLDISNWDTSSVTNMASMFNNCQSLASLDVSNWDTSKVTNMQDMFNFCYSLKNVDVSNWDTSNTQYINGMFGRCRQMTMIDISNFNMSAIKTTDVSSYLHMFVEIPNVKTLIFGNNKFPDNINFGALFGGIQPSSLEKVIVLEEDTMNKLAGILPDRSAVPNSGIIVTNTTISDEAMNTISSKNWSIRKMVAQYRFDANTYEDLIPEFNTEFSSDKYEVNDNVSEIVIDNIQWEDGAISGESGVNSDGTDRVRCVGYYSILPNTTYKCVNNYFNIFWYDESKKFISWVFKDKDSLVVSPTNAKYMRVYTDRVVTNCGISAKLITRSIESKNGDLPTLMRFGQVWVSGETQQDYTRCLLKVLDMNTSELADCNSMFRYCTNLTSINCNWNT